jgi:hypothetical protein
MRFGIETLASRTVVSGLRDAKYAILPTYDSGDPVAMSPI